MNGSFEDGTFTADTVWAGASAVTLASPGSGTSPVFPSLPFHPWVGGWATSSLNGAYWLESPAAQEGDRYVYLSGKDVCLNLLYGTGFSLYPFYQGLTPGQTYRLGFWAASAQNVSGGGEPLSQEVRIEWTEGSTTAVESIALAPNGAWSDASVSDIPWEWHSYDFVPTSANGILTISTNGAVASALVLDGVTLAAVPEPSLALGWLGLALIFRRRR